MWHFLKHKAEVEHLFYLFTCLPVYLFQGQVKEWWKLACLAVLLELGSLIIELIIKESFYWTRMLHLSRQYYSSQKLL